MTVLIRISTAALTATDGSCFAIPQAGVASCGMSPILPPAVRSRRPVWTSSWPGPDRARSIWPCGRCSRSTAVPTPEDRNLQHQQRQPPPAKSPGLAGEGAARCRLPAGTESDPGCIPRSCPPRRGLRRSVAGAADLERRGDPCARSRSGADPKCATWRRL